MSCTTCADASALRDELRRPTASIRQSWLREQSKGRKPAKKVTNMRLLFTSFAAMCCMRYCSTAPFRLRAHNRRLTSPLLTAVSPCPDIKILPRVRVSRANDARRILPLFNQSSPAGGCRKSSPFFTLGHRPMKQTRTTFSGRWAPTQPLTGFNKPCFLFVALSNGAVSSMPYQPTLKDS